jgi:hypothetical protein
MCACETYAIVELSVVSGQLGENMAEQQPTDAWEEVRKIHREHWFFYEISFGAFLVFLIVLIGVGVFGANRDYFQELFMQGLGVVITVLILNRLAERREDNRQTQREIEKLKKRLVMEARSQSNEIAKHAVDGLKQQGWLRGEDGLLKGANLVSANLPGVYLRIANLKGTDLRNANLRGAQLEEANLQSSISRRINLRDARLAFAQLQAADLKDAELQDAKLFETEFSQETILPDGNLWTSDTDLTRFTDPKHVNFWRSDDRRSPAYRGKFGDVSE